MIAKLKFRVQRSLINSLGFKSKRKLIVIESDDWGAIRMPDANVYKKLLNSGIVSNQDPFAKYDGLESNEDLEFLFETLTNIKDYKNNSAVLTANVIVANPNFQAIKETDYNQYIFENVEQTFLQNKEFSIKKKWNEGYSSKVFFPQLHGREHVNVNKWLTKLKNKEQNLLTAFEYNTYAVDHSIAAAFNTFSKEDDIYHKQVIKDSIDLFEELFDFKSKSFIAPNYTWSNSLEKNLYELGIYYLQGSKWQNIPQRGKDEMKRKFHYNGQKNEFNQTYLVRNCLFEPTISPSIDYVDICLRHIENAFFWNAPAIIASHRLNFVSVGGADLRDRNLKALQKLLISVVHKWPDVEFISTDELCRIVAQKNDV